ncbi:MAG: helix-turn-helix transcriptional regulator [Bacteroidales bacterium]|nr:helix-turn-helix transcriptional regulator [Bacteroidales bacterium]
MIASTLPSIELYNKEEPKLSHNSIIFASTSTRYFYPEHKTPNLFISNFLNKGSYVINKKRVNISDNFFYFLNANDDLEICFSNALPLQTLLIFFEENFINNCFSYHNSSTEELLDSPIKCLSNDFRLPNVPFSFINSIKGKTLQLLQETHKEDIDALLFDIITEFLVLNNDTSKQIKKIATAKKSTQEELYRRLFLAKEMMDDNVFEKLSLEQIAQEVCLNKFHFLSNFKSLYGITPHQYFMELKLQKAFNLLQNRQYTVTETCFLMGFESLGSFSNSFKKRFHLSPSVVFNQNKIPNFR